MSAADFDLDAGGLGEARHAGARVDLLDQIGRLGAQRLAHLVGAPLLLDRVLDLVERAISRGVDLGDVEPEKAVVLGVQRSVVDADVGGEDGAQQRLFVRQIDGGAAGVEPLRIDGRDVASLEADGLGGLAERLAGHARVLDLVVDRSHVIGGAAGRDILLHDVGDFGVALDASRA